SSLALLPCFQLRPPRPLSSGYTPTDVCAKGTPFATIPAMPIEQIVQQLRAERDRLDAAIKALTGVAGATLARSSGGRKKTMSAAARRRISIAQKARWAKMKAGKK